MWVFPFIEKKCSKMSLPPHCYSQKCESSAHWKKMRENRQMHCQQTHCKHSLQPNGHTFNKWKENTREMQMKKKKWQKESYHSTLKPRTQLWSLCACCCLWYTLHTPCLCWCHGQILLRAQEEQPSYCKSFYVCVCAYVRMTEGRPTLWTHLNFLSIKNEASLSTLVLDKSSHLQHLVPFMNWQWFSPCYALLSFSAGHTHLKSVPSGTWYCHTAPS